MAKIATALNDTQIKNAKPGLKPIGNKKTEKVDGSYALYDGDGLFLEITKTGSKLWRLKYKSPITGTDKKIALGKYPVVTLADARDKKIDLLKEIDKGICPMTQKKLDKANPRTVTTFNTASQEWLNKMQIEWSDSHYDKQKGRVEKHLSPHFGDLPIDQVTDDMIIDRIDQIQETGTVETGIRVFQIANQIFKRLKTRRKIKHNPLADIEIKDAFLKAETTSYPAPTTEKDLKAILKAINSYSGGEYSTRMALQILPHVFLRSESLRLAEWDHIDFDANTWTIPTDNLKLKKDQKADTKNSLVIQMSTQVQELLKELQRYTGSDKYLFPSPVGKNRTLTGNGLGQAMQRSGISQDEAVPHSFRSSFSSLFRDNRMKHKVSDEAIERALSHKFGNAVTQVYNRSTLEEEFKILYQWWSDYLEDLINE